MRAPPSDHQLPTWGWARRGSFSPPRGSWSPLGLGRVQLSYSRCPQTPQVGAQSYKTGPSPHQMPLGTQVVMCADPPARDWRFQQSPPSGSTHSPQRPPERGNRLLTRLQVSYQKNASGPSSWKRSTGQGLGKRGEVTCPPEHAAPPTNRVFTNLEALQTRSFGGCMEASFHRHDCKSLATGDRLSRQPLARPGREGRQD